MVNKGLLYVATGKKYVREAIKSYASFKRFDNALPAVIYTDVVNKETAEEHFDHVEIIDSPAYCFLDKVAPLVNSPFEKTLFIDSDTYLNQNIDELWAILDDYDLAFTFDNGRINDPLENVPDWFCEYSTGIILYNKCEIVQTLFEKWEIEFSKMRKASGMTVDQPSFRKSLWEVKPKFFTLPQEYNFSMYANNISANGYPIKIFHGRYDDFEKAIEHLSSGKPTLYVNEFRFLERGTIKSFNYYESENWFFQFFMSCTNYYHRLIHRLGFSKTAAASKRRGNKV
ncbi:MAG: hypothetical protein ABJH98_02960 [Reichenbachiella sp.]|uniref:hypothetical protein n=1 Tax=Reichenbachiella sp. TaxID=2184521 RepID=UPI0032970D34